MNWLSNIWNHPKTTLAGLLVGIGTIAGVLSQQGITLGHAGTGTVVTLISGIAAALLGLVAQYPGGGGATGPLLTGKMLGLILLGPVLIGSLTLTACTGSQVNQVVSEINAYLPTVVAIVNDALQIAAAVGTNPSASAAAVNPTVVNALTVVEADLKNLEPLVATYLAKASGSSTKATAWSNIQAIVDTAAADADNLLELASVKNANSNAQAVVVISSLDAAVHILDGFVSSAQPVSAVQKKLAARTVKLSTLMKQWTPADRENVVAHLGAPAVHWALQS